MRDQVQVARTIAQRSGQPFRGEIAIIADHGLPSPHRLRGALHLRPVGFAGFQLLVLKARLSSTADRRPLPGCAARARVRKTPPMLWPKLIALTRRLLLVGGLLYLGGKIPPNDRGGDG
jgi:hypothetical protein